MGAIAGIYGRGGMPPQQRDLDCMLARLARRAPGYTAQWWGATIGLGALQPGAAPGARLISGPLAEDEGRLVVVADARIDNRRELAGLLGLCPTPKEQDEATLILAAYRRWGERAPEYLLGDFAFAVWDADRRQLFCARDPFGVKQFYYCCASGPFAFATEIKALLAAGTVQNRLNEARLADLLLARPDDGEATLYQSITRLPPATSMTIRPDSITTRRYWRIDPQRELRLRSDDEYAERYRELLTEAISCRLRGQGPAGATLSGGLASSSVACLARDLLADAGRERLRTFSAIYDGAPGGDERPYVEPVLAQGSVVPIFVPTDWLNPLADLYADPWHDDEPLLTPQAALSSSLYESARQGGVSIMLEGLGGSQAIGADEPTYTGPLLRLALAARPQEVPLHPDFSYRLNHWREQDPNQPQAPLDATAYLPYKDRLSAAAGVEPRYPYLDRRLVEFCAALPPEQRERSGWSRWVARYALGGVLPEKLRWRPGKANHSPAFTRTLLQRDRAVLDSILVNAPGPLADYVNMPEIERRYKHYIDSDGQEDGLPLWQVASLGLWLRRRSVALLA